MRLGTIALAAGITGLAALIPGCFRNTCLLTTCDGPYCRCSVATCAPGSAFDTRVGRCRCLPGYALLGGRCLSPRTASAYCGAGYHWENNGCAPNQVCRPGDELDHATGMCIPREQVNQVASNMGISVGPGQKLGCPAGQKLVIDGQNAACVPVEQTCARDEIWNGTACVKAPPPACAEGSAWDAAQGKCVELAKEAPPEAEPAPVNVAPWTAATYGPDGGNGAPGFCSAFARKPWSFGVNEGSSALVRVTVSLTFPEGQIARGVVQTRAAFAASGSPVPAKGAADVEAAAKAAAAPLIEQGGRASANTAATTVRCLVVNASRPAAVPATGGL